MTDHAELLDRLSTIAAAAGNCILAIVSHPHGWTPEGDGSPLTEADLATEEVTAAGLAEAAPGIPVVSEEAAMRPEVWSPPVPSCWSTRSMARGNSSASPASSP